MRVRWTGHVTRVGTMQNIVRKLKELDYMFIDVRIILKLIIKNIF